MRLARFAGTVLLATLALTPLGACRKRFVVAETLPPPPWFVDATERSRVDFVHDSGFRTRLLFPEGASGGCCMFDYDGDGWMDLYFVQAHPLDPAVSEPRKPNRLFRNRRDGTFEDVTASAGVAGRGYGLGCACGDYDGDGDTDLFVTNLGPDILYRNDGGATFTDVTTAAGVTGPGFGASAAFVDFDEDGHLDLFVVQDINWSVAGEIRCAAATGEPDYCKPDNYRAPATPILYRNRGDATFEDVTARSGVSALPGNGLGIACADFNGDGRIDLYVANDGDPNRLWINEGNGRFREEALIRGCAVSGDGVEEAGMGVVAADLRDAGIFDILVTNLIGETNTLYLGSSDGHFHDATRAAGLAGASRPHTGWGVGFHDFDHDGTLDLYVANGGVTLPFYDTGASGRARYAEPNHVFRGLGGARFAEVLPRGGTASPIVKSSRATAFGDLDNDGDVDVVVANSEARCDVLENVVERRGNAATFRIVNSRGADAIGALVRLTAGDVMRHRWVMPSYGYLASNDPRIHVGLGGASEVASVTVRWPGGTAETFGPFAAGAFHEIREGGGRVLPAAR